MRIIIKYTIRFFALACLALLAFFARPTAAYNPVLSVSGSGADLFFNLQSGPPNSSINIYYTLPGSSLPTSVSNFGYTDGSGNFSTSISSSNYGLSGASQIYVSVGGLQSNTVSIVNNQGGCGFFGCGGSLSLSQNSVNISSGQTAYVTAYNSPGSLYISSNSNPAVVSASVSGNQISLYGLSSGSSNVTVCGNWSQCANISVSVGWGGGGGLVLSQNSLNLNVGQTAMVSVSGPAFSNYYVSSNSNPGVASVSIQGNTVNVYAQSWGFTAVGICQSSGQCATLSVNVNNAGGWGNLRFLTSSLPAAVAGQYYSQQLQASGGNPPYNFYLSGGQLPAGLSLSSSGQIYGVPQAGQSSAFWVSVRDNSGQTASMNYSLQPSWTGQGGGLPFPGAVRGAGLYASGSLISERGTVYIVYKNTKTGFASAAVFRGLGYDFSEVVTVGNSGLADSGYVVTSSFAAHPWGSWVRSGQTVYFVHDSGLIPVPDWNTFLANGGRAGLIVPANSSDYRLPTLSPMTYNDNRLY